MAERRTWWWGALAAAAIAGALGWWLWGRTTVASTRVTGHRWERVIVLEKFDGNAWKPVYEVKSTGTGVHGMTWPEDVPPADVAARAGELRAGPRIEFLYLELGTLGTCRVGEGVWRKYEAGDAIPDAVRGRDGKLACAAL
jgi:hypothetical protein